MVAIEHNKQHPFFVLGFCYCERPITIARHLSKLLSGAHNRHIYPNDLNEIKFYPTPALRKLGYSEDEINAEWAKHYPEIRNRVLKVILKHSNGVFAGIQDKTTISSHAWTSERLGNHIFKESLLQYILPNLNRSTDISIIYDRGRLNPKRTEAFNRDLRSSMSNGSGVQNRQNIRVLHDEDSLDNPGIWAGDFVAGAFHHALKHGDPTYSDALRPRYIGSGFMKF